MSDGWCQPNLGAVRSLTTRTPQTVGDVRRLLGFLSYYRAFIQDFSRVAKPLYELLQAKPGTTQDPHSKKRAKGPQIPSRSPVEWIRDHQQIPGRTNWNVIKPTYTGISGLQLILHAPHWHIWKGPRGHPLSATRREVESNRIWVQNIDNDREELPITQWQTYLCDTHKVCI